MIRDAILASFPKDASSWLLGFLFWIGPLSPRMAAVSRFTLNAGFLDRFRSFSFGNLWEMFAMIYVDIIQGFICLSI